MKRFSDLTLNIIFNRFYVMIGGGFYILDFFSCGGVEVLIDLSQAGLFIFRKRRQFLYGPLIAQSNEIFKLHLQAVLHERKL